MKISDVSCRECGSTYQMAVSNLALGSPGQFECSVCGSALTSWKDSSLRAFRLEMSSQHRYSHVALPPVSPAVL